MYQPNLLFLKEPSNDYLRKIESVFLTLPQVDKDYFTGRPPHPPFALLNALIFKNLRSIASLAELAREIRFHPAIAQVCGFKSFPCRERFSSFLKDTPNRFFQDIREKLVLELIKTKEIKGKYVSTDSCPLKSPVRENNLKTSVPNRFDKTNIPKTDPECRLGTYTVYPLHRKVQFFWGYRNFILNDAVSELPIDEITRPANFHDSQMLVPRLQYIKERLPVKIQAVIGDAGFDSSSIIEYIAKDLQAKPIIAKNPRGGSNPDIKLSSKGTPVCVAGLELISWGKFYDRKRGYMRHKFVCPIKARKKIARRFGFCPWNHPNFFNNRFGCVVNIKEDADPSIRNSIDYDSRTFKKLYAMRTSSERIFSRFLTFCMQEPSIRGLNANSNVCTIAHITLLALALSAVRAGQADKIRFIKRLVPHF